MKTDEVKEKVKKERIKHSFPRHEVYHRWIHSPEYCYTNKGQRYAVSGYLNWLIVGDFGKQYVKEYNKEDIINHWANWRRQSAIAAINRETKQIFISLVYKRQAYELINSVPDDYEIFFTKEEIPIADILSPEHLSEACKLHATYLVEVFINAYFDVFYGILDNTKKTCHIDYNSAFYFNESEYTTGYKSILDFVRKHKLNKEDWYDKAIDKPITLVRYNGWKKEFKSVQRPTLKAVVTKKIFNDEEILLINQRAFYTKYCYGFGISFEDTKWNWNKSIDKEGFIALRRKINFSLSYDDLEVKPTSWRDAIKILRIAYDKSYYENDEAARKESNENYKAALNELNRLKNNVCSVENWRNGMSLKNLSVEYKRYIPSDRRFTFGKWTIDTLVTSSKSFDNVQLLLKDNTVVTSKSATVSLNDAINMYKLYSIIVNRYSPVEGVPIMVRLEDKHYNVGIYNLRAIQYNQKKTDAGKLLNKWEWCVVIGCHYIWIDDFINFIDYYNLYELFGIEVHKDVSEESKNVQKVKQGIKIKIKK